MAYLIPGSLGANGPSPALYLVLTVPVFPYAAYWALSIRHALAVPLYRRQAFGVAFIVLAFWGAVSVFVLVPNFSATPVEAIEQFAAFYFLFIALFYWIDASVRASRRSDPLNRDTFYWSRVRMPIWIAIIVTTAIPFIILGYVLLASDTALFNQLNSGDLGGPIVSFFLNYVLFNFPIIIPVCGLIYIPAIAIRSKWDRSLRRHYLWFVPTSFVFLWIFFGNPNSQVGDFVTPLLVVVMGYALYRSARALVPLNLVSRRE